MLKKFGMILLTASLVFSFIGCYPEEPLPDYEFIITLGDNFQYGEGYQGQLKGSDFVKYFGDQGQLKGKTFEVDMEYQVLDLAWDAEKDDDLEMGIAGTGADDDWWLQMSDDDDVKPIGKSDALAKAGLRTPITEKIELKISEESKDPSNVVLNFQFKSTRGTPGTQGSGAGGERRIIVTKFEVKEK